MPKKSILMQTEGLYDTKIVTERWQSGMIETLRNTEIWYDGNVATLLM